MEGVAYSSHEFVWTLFTPGFSASFPRSMSAGRRTGLHGAQRSCHFSKRALCAPVDSAEVRVLDMDPAIHRRPKYPDRLRLARIPKVIPAQPIADTFTPDE